MGPAARLAAYARLVRLDKPVGILLLLWPTLWGLWIAAGGVPAPGVLAVFVAGTVLMRSAGCAINDFADRRFDAHVKRTRGRPLAAGEISPQEAVLVAAVLALVAFLLVVWTQNGLTIGLAVAAGLLAAIYPFTKRFFSLPQAWLGLCFGFGIPMAFAAVTGAVPALAWVLLVANVFWTLAYDTEYAMVDRDDDLRIGIRTSAILFGRADVAMVMAFQGLFLATMAASGAARGAGWPWTAGLAAGGLLALSHFRLIRGRDRDGCFLAFRRNHWIGFAVFAGTVLDFALPR